MIQMSIQEIAPGMVLARSLVNENGDLLLASGFVITERILGKLRSIGLSGCWIYEEGTEYVIPEEMISEQLGNQTQGVLKENMEMLKEALRTQELTQESLDAALKDSSRFKNIIAAERVKNTARDLINELMGREPVIVNVSSIRTKSGWMYQHALDVTVTGIMLGFKLGYTLKELEELAMGCLLMDLGMVLISDNILAQDRPLNGQERNLLREHTTLGYAVLRENDKVALTTAHVAYQHHERQDGQGYPRGLHGDNTLPLRKLTSHRNSIHRYAEIAAVADIYNSLLCPRPGGKVRTPDEVMRILITAAGSHLNKAVVDMLITMVPVYPVGSRITVVEDGKSGRLAGYSGVVAKSPRDDPEHPVVILLYDRDKKKLGPITIDLAEESGIRIQFARLQ